MLALVVAGTRPEIIKLSPVIRVFQARGIEFIFLATGQHYDLKLFGNFLSALELPQPHYNLEVGSGTQAYQTSRVLEKLEDVILGEGPGFVLAQGDTNAVLSAALASTKLHTPFVHLEAGLRSFDFTMPEEVNRVLADRLGSVLFAPTERSGLNLLREGIHRDRVFVTGNTIVDATRQNLRLAEEKADIGLPESYCLLTLHRAENVDSRKRLGNILEVLGNVEEEIIFAAHPRTVKRMEEFGLAMPGNVKTVEPLGYMDFLYALNHSRAVFTDSGGVQEEALVLGVPCVTLRTSTERPETIQAQGNILAGVSKTGIEASVNRALSGGVGFRDGNLLGDGRAGVRVAETLEKLHVRGKLAVAPPEEKLGEEGRRFVRVGEKLVGKRLSQVEGEVQRVIEGGEEVYPRDDLVLKKGMLLELIERKFY